MSAPDFPAITVRIGAGVAVWALHFAAIYAAAALACARDQPAVVMPVASAVTLVAVVVLMSIAWRGWARRARFDYWMSATVAGLALLAVTWEAVPVLLLLPCE